ncbi:endonuclease [Pedobacter yulinensis]|uniref:Endonuclease n=1 Tax=Pedobacter yulinensis TaxID=2126353 RepID=A0A2T3HPF3_9SPHI|nr:FG-GAP-like repeat-containing protein [Pedobacter yulinensis]PST84322.1 endonuclease [Pedobacter yulinensis]
MKITPFFQSIRGAAKPAVFLVIFALAGLSSCKRQETGSPASVSLPKPESMALVRIAGQTPFKVLSFNVRHNAAGDPQSITERQGIIRQVIVDNSPDVFGLQEFSDNDFETWFREQMAALGYGEYYDTAITGSPKAIFFKNSRFTKTGSGTMDIGPSNTGTWVILQDKTNNRRYFISNSHWQFDSVAVRIENAEKLVAGITAANTENLPKIVFGDFNAIPGTTEIGILKSGLDVVDALGDSEGEPTFHGWTATGTKKLDWVMSDRAMAFTTFKVIKTSYNGFWPSDHWPVMATYIPAVLGGPHADANGLSTVASTNFYFADVNGDDKADKIYWRYNYDGGTPQIYLSNGNGTFASPAIKHPAGASTLQSTRYHYADINGDGKDDQIVWDPTLYSGRTRVFLATSAGNFSTTAIENPEGTSAGSTTVFHFADVNGDSKADKIYWNASFDSGKTRVYLATANGSFDSSVVAGPEGASTTAGTIFYYADLNRDSRMDKMRWHPSLNSGKVMVYLSDGDGTFTAAAGFSDSGASSGLASTVFYFADINGDGRAEKIYWNPSNYLGKVKVYYATASNTFDGPVYSLRGTSQSENTRFYFADITGDAHADQVRWNPGENSGELRNYFAY